MLYTIRHVTKFSYERAISESVMEARMQPRSEGRQRCVRFGLSTTPSSRVRIIVDTASGSRRSCTSPFTSMR